MTSRPVNTVRPVRPVKITIQILSNISQSKDSQTIKLGQLIEYIKKNIFL